jgi:hypothetical protein
VLEPVDGVGLEPHVIMERIAERIEEVPGGLEGKIVRLSLVNISRESYKNLDHKLLRQLRARALHLTLDITFTSTVYDGQVSSKPGQGLLRDQLVEFSRTWEVPGVSHEEIADMLQRYLLKVEASHEAS